MEPFCWHPNNVRIQLVHVISMSLLYHNATYNIHYVNAMKSIIFLMHIIFVKVFIII